jgi:hypothetical protein
MTYFKVQQEVPMTYFKVPQGSGHDIFSGISRQLSEESKNITNASGREVGVPKENRSKHFRTQVRNIITCANLLGNTRT